MVSRSNKKTSNGKGTNSQKKRSRGSNGATSSTANMKNDDKMITHIAADGEPGKAENAAAVAIDTLSSSAASAASESMNTNAAQADNGNDTNHDNHGDNAVPMKVVETQKSSDTDEDPLSLDVLLDMDERLSVPRKSGCCRRIGKYTLVTLLVWSFQVFLAVSLKRYGYIEQDLNQILAQRIMPQLQQQIEQTLLGFNESTATAWYQRFMNESISMGYIMQEKTRPGFNLAQEGAHGQYPVIMIPGFVTSGLEVWSGKECAKNYFRQRMWGGIGTARLLLERDCALQHLALDPLTGGDPEGIRMRAAQGFEAADYFMANYWVWGKILENLADMGYDASTMSMESYDWRLAFPVLEKRDGYLTKLRFKVEAFKKTSGKKVIISSHSLGAILVHYFFTWVTTSEEEGGGGGGPNWVDEHVHAYVNIAGAHLGVPKASTALFSGEMSDTIFMGTAGTLVEQFLGKRMRRDLWSTWGSVWTMLPKGGDSIWNVGGDVSAALSDGKSDDEDGKDHSSTTSKNLPELPSLHEEYDMSPMVIMTDKKSASMSTDTLEEPICASDQDSSSSLENQVQLNEVIKSFFARQVHSTTDMIDFLLQWGSGLGSSLAATKQHSFDPDEEPSSKTWHDVSRTPLPYAPNLKIYCLYGVGLATERSYYYKRNADAVDAKPNNNSADGDDDNCTRSSPLHHYPGDPPFVIDSSVEDPDNKVIHGIQYVDGDRSVPLISLGYMCADGWQRDETGLNPSGIEVITREYQHKKEFSVEDPMRRGPESADHVDILGHVKMMEDFMKIVSDHRVDEVGTRIVSDIEHIAKRINEHPKGGLKKIPLKQQKRHLLLKQQAEKLVKGQEVNNKEQPKKRRGRLWPFGRR